SSNNTIGGTAPAAGNLISGNAINGIYMPNSSSNLFQGNHIGTNAAGSARLPNSFTGIFAPGAASNTVGGTTAGARNVIAGNNAYGVEFNGVAAMSNLVQGNYVGTDVTATFALANNGYGVILDNGASLNTVG